MKRFWVYFRGTRNGQYIEAESMKAAKLIFAMNNHLTSITYIAGRKT